MRKFFFPIYLVAVVLIMNFGSPAYAAAQASDLVEQGRQALAAEKFDDALATFEKAVAADPTNAAALAWFGHAQVRKTATVSLFERPSWVKRGMETLDQAVQRFPNEAIVYVVRGNTAARLPAFFAKAPLAIKDLNTV